jgi:hypothetical protein
MIGSLFLKDRRRALRVIHTHLIMIDYACDDPPSPGIDHRRMTRDSRYFHCPAFSIVHSLELTPLKFQQRQSPTQLPLPRTLPMHSMELP